MEKLKKTIKNDLWVILLDAIAVNVSYFLALIIRFYVDNQFNPTVERFLLVFYRFAPYYTIACIAVFYLFRLYGGIWRYAGINDMNRIISASFVTCAIHVLGTILFFKRMPITYYVIGAVIQFVLISAIRFAYRLIRIEQKRMGRNLPAATIVGTGENGLYIKYLLDSGVAFRPACIVDVENKYVGSLIDGLPVYEIDQIENALSKYSVQCVFLAEENLDSELRDQIKKACEKNHIELRDYSSYFSFSGESDQFTGMQNVVKGPAEKDGKRNIPFSPPDIGELEIGEVVEAMRSGWITTGPRTKLLERRLAAYIETGKTDVDTESDITRWSNRVVCLNSGTAAEELNLKILGIREGDEVIVPAYSYTASASAAVHCGAKIIFVDILKDGDPVYHMPEMDYEKLEEAITEKTKAVILVDLGGIVCDYERVFEIVKRKKDLFHPMESDGTVLNDLSSRIQKALGRVAVVSDCAHGLGASRIINGEKKYTGAIADFTSFSFHAVKNFTTAEGGASSWLPIEGISNSEIYQTFQLLSLHGQNKDALAKTKIGAWEYDIIGPWYKCNMTDIMAAIGLRQLDRYLGLLDRRAQMMKKYDEVCNELGISHMIHHTSDMDSSNHLYLIRIPGIDTEQRNEIIEKMAEHGVMTNVHYKPMPMMTAYKNMGWDIKDFPNTYDYYHNLITIPFHTLLTDEDVEYVCEVLKEVITKARS